MKKLGIAAILIIIMSILPIEVAWGEPVKEFPTIDDYSVYAEKSTGYVTIIKNGKQLKLYLNGKLLKKVPPWKSLRNLPGGRKEVVMKSDYGELGATVTVRYIMVARTAPRFLF